MTRFSRKRTKQEIHFLTGESMVAYNPRDREAAHRAEVENIATENIRDVTCTKCWDIIRKTGNYRKSDQ